MAELRRQGVFNENLATKKTKIVQPSEFNIGGIIGQFERKYKRAYKTNNAEEHLLIFGDGVNSSFFGDDVVTSFWSNVDNVAAKLWVKAHVATDAVSSVHNLKDAGPVDTLRIEPAFETEIEFGISGNRTAVVIQNGFRFSTTASAVAAASATTIRLASVVKIKVGDIIKVVLTSSGSPITVYHKILTIDESTGNVTFAGPLNTGASTLVVGDAVQVIGFRLRTFRKSITGIISEVEEDRGEIFCTMESEVTDFYVQNVHKENSYIKSSDLASATPLEGSFPVDVGTVFAPIFLTGGLNGTAPTTNTLWFPNLAAFDNKPIRFLTNCEDTQIATNKDGETYCKGRDDNPKWIYHIPSNQTKSQLITLGNKYQRSNGVLGVICANYIGITDQYTTSANAPDRAIPNVGFVMGAWIRSIVTLGIHYIPAIDIITLTGANSVIGDEIVDQIERTEVANAGINMIHNREGIGIQIRSLFTPSTALEFQFANGILMREYFKISFKDSLQSSENRPNSFERILQDKTAIDSFYRRHWERGSNGNAPEGETFGQQEGTTFDDHVQVKADILNNPQSSINLGNRNIDSWFTFPTPAGSIRIGVGLLLRD